MVEKGDARALGLIERLFAESAQHVEVPKTLAQLRALLREQRDQLMAQLERKHGPTLSTCPSCGAALLASRLPAEPDLA
jgi:hypothetical protein